MESKRVIKQIEADGWKLLRVRGSHHVFHKEGTFEKIVLSHPKKDVTIGQLRAAEKASGLKFK